jgi:hypothetical protein
MPPADVEKSAENKTRGRPFTKGDPRAGKGKKGRSGRPTNEFRQSLRDLVDSPSVQAAVKKILKDADHRQFSKLYATVVAQAHGAPKQEIDVDGVPPVFKIETE